MEGAGNSSSISSNEDMDTEEMVSKELEKIPASLTCKGAAASAALEGDYHANSITSLIQERRKLLEEKKLIRKSEWKASSEKEVKERAAFESDMVYLPDLAWEKVFEYVKDSKDKKQLFDMTELWRNLLLNERAEFLFPSVLPLLVKTKSIKLKHSFDCRLVCQTWKKSFDDCLQQPSKRFNSWCDLAEHATRFPAYTQDQAAFLQKFPPTDQNPFLVSRSLKLNRIHHIRGNAFAAPIWQMAMEINSLFVNFSNWYIDPAAAPLTENWHNLKHLGIAYFMVNAPNLVRHRIMRGLPDAEMPLGGIPADLETLALYDVSNVYPIVTAGLLRRVRTSLKTLVIKGWLWQHLLLQRCMSEFNNLQNPVEIMQYFGPFPELKTLMLQTSTGCPEIPAQCKEFAPSLEEMEWKYTYANYRRDVPASCRGVNIIGNSLRRLCLSFTNPYLSWSTGYFDYHEFPEENLRLNLPRLEVLELTLECWGVKNIDFILPCESLKEFNLTFSKPFKIVTSMNSGGSSQGQQEPPSQSEKSSEEETIDFNGFEEQMYESNVWEIFPDLRKLRISILNPTVSTDGQRYFDSEKKRETKLYTRHGLKKYQGAKNNL